MQKIILYMDGGLCSQICFMALGKYFQDKGYQVKYDMSWYEENADLPQGTYALDKAFPSITIESASKEEITLYKQKYTTKPKLSTLDIIPPAYVGGYRQDEFFIAKYKDFFLQAFHPKEFDDTNSEQYKLLKEIQETNSCGVHCRRGDLSEFHPVYGSPADVKYFLETINIINKTNKNVYFYLFSDTPEWVKENIVPHLSKDIKYRICNKNDQTKGYLDFYLLTWCKHIISSNGSFGPMAKLLSKNKKTTLWMCKNLDYMESPNLDNVYVYVRPQTIIPKHKLFEEFIPESKITKKYKKYKGLFNAMCVILAIYTFLLGYLVFK
ncbi:alpha-1,2-fucosyltransferase [Helicobacter sp. 23-1048]